MGYSIRSVKNTTEKTRKYVRYEEGAAMYSMGLSKFITMAREAKATYKVDRLVLVNTDKFEEYLETFRED